MDIQRIAAFCHEGGGGNPAGVVLLEAALPDTEMAQIAAEVGYSETAFAVRMGDGTQDWRVRYFAPEAEVPFCGHATIALGAVLGAEFGLNTYNLTLNAGTISVVAETRGGAMAAVLSSPPTRSEDISDSVLSEALGLLGMSVADLDPRLPPARIHGGADHLMLALKDRDRLATMTYDLAQGREIMRRHGFVTIMLVYVDAAQTFVVRNAFASGGVLEDPATGAAAAAFAGYLRDVGWPHGGQFAIRQGEDMGMPSRIEVSLSDEPGAPVHVAGQARRIVSDD